jgi:quercetin dioxygenase-like cupin family protein
MMDYFCDAAGREKKVLAPGIVARTFWGEKMLMSLVDIEPGAALPLHSHPHEQHGTIMAGVLHMTIDGETRALTAGDIYVIPGGIVHGAEAGPEGAQVLDIFAPVREEYKY